jgi:hypothetical protein
MSCKRKINRKSSLTRREIVSEFCPYCKKRISDWMNANGKTEFVAGVRVHKACQMDVPKRHNNDHEDDCA